MNKKTNPHVKQISQKSADNTERYLSSASSGYKLIAEAFARLAESDALITKYNSTNWKDFKTERNSNEDKSAN